MNKLYNPRKITFSVSQFPQFLIEENKNLLDLRIKYPIKARNVIKIPLLLISHVTLTGGPLCNVFQPLEPEGGNQVLQNPCLHVGCY